MKFECLLCLYQIENDILWCGGAYLPGSKLYTYNSLATISDFVLYVFDLILFRLPDREELHQCNFEQPQPRRHPGTVIRSPTAQLVEPSNFSTWRKVRDRQPLQHAGIIHVAFRFLPESSPQPKFPMCHAT